MLRRVLKQTVKSVVGALGYQVVPADRTTADGLYGAVRTHTIYSPWNTDAEFSRIFDLIQPQTLVDRYRCYELWSLVEQVRHLQGSLLEVGVWNGGTGALIARQANRTSPGSRTYLCDTFKGVVKANAEDPRYRGGEHSDASRANVERLLARVGATDVTILEGIFPDDTAAQIPPGPFKFCHVDVDVYQSAKETTEWVWGRLVPGGIIVYDDYGFFGCDGVRTYVDAQRGRTDLVVLYNLNGHAVIVKIR